VDSNARLRQLPSIDRVLKTSAARELKERWLPRLVDAEVRAVVDEMRARMLEEGGGAGAEADPERLAALAGERLARRLAPGVVRCVNATGVVLHTGLGRAVLPKAAVDAIARETSGYCVVSVDREEGQRIRRESAVARMLAALTGAEAATVVNNNAAATLLALNTLAAGREAILSRGQLVEIGGSFRMPDVFAAAGVRLREVGTTNRTHLADYARAIGPETALLLRVHPSNFRVVGFTHDVPLAELVALGRERNVPVMDDLGAGALVPVPPEPELAESLRLGADLVCCSGDKLIGGPQAGLLLGRAAMIDRVRKNPLFRALRVDKLTLAALEATLGLFLRAEGPGSDHPTLWMLSRRPDELERAARRLAARIREAVPGLTAGLVAGASQVGSGSLPGEELPTTLVTVDCPGSSADRLARRLRLGAPPVFARIVEDRVCLDPRTLLPGDDERIVEALGNLT
jgi:L-seryl-tRNA(Ser) seleniumtransferase